MAGSWEIGFRYKKYFETGENEIEVNDLKQLISKTPSLKILELCNNLKN